MSILKKIVGSRNDRILKNYRKILNDVNSFSDEMKKVSLILKIGVTKLGLKKMHATIKSGVA